MYPQELMSNSSTADESPSWSPVASRKRQLGGFPQHLLQHDEEDEDASTDSDSDASHSKRLRHESSPMASPKRTSSRKDGELSAAARPNMSASHSITLEMLRPHFEEPLAQVAKTFGICVTLLKKICRKHGLSRWPHRQITGLRKSIASMEHAIGYFEGERRDAYAEQLRKQKTKLALLLEDPTRCNPSLPLSPQTVPSATASVLLPPASSFSPSSSASSYSSPASSLRGTLVFPSSIYQSPLSSMDQVRLPCDSFEAQKLAYPVLPSGFLSQRQSPTYFESHRLHQEHLQLHQRAPIGSVCLPPLRTEPRRVLPPIASLVGNASAW